MLPLHFLFALEPFHACCFFPLLPLFYIDSWDSILLIYSSLNWHYFPFLIPWHLCFLTSSYLFFSHTYCMLRLPALSCFTAFSANYFLFANLHQWERWYWHLLQDSWMTVAPAHQLPSSVQIMVATSLEWHCVFLCACTRNVLRIASGKAY